MNEAFASENISYPFKINSRASSRTVFFERVFLFKEMTQEEIVIEAEFISKNYYSIIRGLKGDNKERVTQEWLNELSVLRAMYDALRED